MNDLIEYLNIIVSPSSYSHQQLDELNTTLGDLYSSENIYLTENGRSALYIAIKALALPPGSKIAVQPFTCNSAVNPIIWNGHIPVYVDIDRSTLNMSPSRFKELLDKESDIRAVLVQYTFGNPTGAQEIIQIAHDRGILAIEDCAHALGVIHDGETLGKKASMAVISFGLEKTLPTKVGGALIVNDPNFVSPVEQIYSSISYTSRIRTFLWVINPIIRLLSRKSGAFGSNVLIPLFERLGIFNTGFEKSELSGGQPRSTPSKLSPLLARVVSHYLGELGILRSMRSDQVDQYRKSLDWMREIGCILPDWNGPFIKFPVILPEEIDRDELRSFLQNRGSYISDWYDPVIYPTGTVLEGVKYMPGTCPLAESVSKQILNLPTGKAFNPKLPDDLKDYLR
ncbi:DegT/DnrJ/EryC1/StrS family aminotransferase, partial [Candidatus Nomurabacteria bacterium]|nr:DegT/DnrJ/EryC1/StrS family aminotransferase [Candidatus Nomurabacteria bacterium]